MVSGLANPPGGDDYVGLGVGKIVNDDEFFDDRYGLQAYLAIEPNIHF